jgi:hypothetical protein
MSLHIHRFIDAIKAAEARGQRDLQISLRDAKDLHGDITKLLLTLEQLHQDNTAQNSPITVEIQGGSFRDS